MAAPAGATLLSSGPPKGATLVQSAPAPKPSSAAPPPPESKPQSWTDILGGALSTVGDIAGGLASGVVNEGIPSVLGLPGDVKGGMDWLNDNAGGLIMAALGAKQSDIDAYKSSMAETRTKLGPNLLPSTADIQGAEAKAGVPQYTPTTIPGQYAQTIGAFLPGAVTGDVESWVPRLIRYGVIPAVASETAGQVTKGTPFEQAARIAAGVAAGGRAAASDRTGVVAAQTLDQIDATANKLYDAADKAGVQVSPQSMTALAGKVADLAKDDPSISPGFVDWYKAATDRVTNNGTQPISWTAFDKMRSRIGKAAMTSQDPNIRYAAGEAKDIIDDHVDTMLANPQANFSPKQAVGPQRPGYGSPQAAVAFTKAARKVWVQKRKAEVVQKLLSDAETDAKSTSTRTGYEGQIQRKFAQLSKNDKKMRAFTPDERAAIQDIARTDPAKGLIKLLGKFAIRGVLSGLTDATLGSIFGPFAGLAAAGIGEGARAVSRATINQKVNAFDTMVRGGTVGRRRNLVPAFLSGAGGVQNALQGGNTAAATLGNAKQSQ